MNKIFLIILIFILYSFSGLHALEVKGRLLDEKFFPVHDVIIYITNGNSAKTDDNGCFRLITSIANYNLTIVDAANALAVTYSGMTISDPELIMFGASSSRYVNTQIVRVDFPPIRAGRSVLIKFMSDDVFYSQETTALPGERTKLITVDFPSTKNSINGKIIYLEKTPTSYERYGEKTISVGKDFFPQTVVYDSSSYFSKPEDAYLTIYMPTQDYDRKGFSVYADFLSLHRNARILLNTSEGDIVSTKVLVPRTLPSGYRIKITGSGYIKNGAGFENYTYSYPGASFNITSENPPSLEAPQDKFYWANNNTSFAFDRGSGTGIFVVHFHCFDPVGDYYFATSDRNISSPLMSSSGVLKGTEYSWSVSKYLTYISVDDFAKVRKFSNDVGYKAISTSELRTFRTKLF